MMLADAIDNFAMNTYVFYGMCCLLIVVMIAALILLILFIVKMANRNKPE